AVGNQHGRWVGRALGIGEPHLDRARRERRPVGVTGVVRGLPRIDDERTRHDDLTAPTIERGARFDSHHARVGRGYHTQATDDPVAQPQTIHEGTLEVEVALVLPPLFDVHELAVVEEVSFWRRQDAQAVVEGCRHLSSIRSLQGWETRDNAPLPSGAPSLY